MPPGPNGPVGVVWIDVSKEHYGLHGTPEPSQIGRTESHGCVRLTNWDACASPRSSSREREWCLPNEEDTPDCLPTTGGGICARSPPAPACGLLGGAVLVVMLLWQYNWIASHRGAHAGARTTRRSLDPGLWRIERRDQPTGTTGSRTPVAAASAAAASAPAPASADELKDRDLLIPVEGVKPEQLTRQFSDERSGSRQHEAHRHPGASEHTGACCRGRHDSRLFLSKAGGITAYQFDPTERFLLLLRAPRTLRRRPARGPDRSKGADYRIRRHFGQCPQKHAAPTLCYFPADGG